MTEAHTPEDIGRMLREQIQRVYLAGRISAGGRTDMQQIAAARADEDIVQYRTRVVNELDALVKRIDPCRTYVTVLINQVLPIDREIARKLYERWRERAADAYRQHQIPQENIDLYLLTGDRVFFQGINPRLAREAPLTRNTGRGWTS